MAADGANDGAVLAAFGIAPDALLGRGGEASIYALDSHRALRLLHAHGDIGQLRRNRTLVDDLVTAPR